MTPLDSRTTLSGSPIEAELTRPLFNMDQRLIFPAGSLVHGEVLKVKAAKSRHRNGQLTFQFTTIAPPLALAPAALPRKIEGSLVSVKVGRDTKNLQITKDGGLKISESKARFIAPVWAFIKAERSLNATADPFPEALLGAYRGKLFKQFSTTESGSLGLPASISGAMIPAVGIGLGVYGAARSVYTNFLGRGQDIRFPVNTPMQIRLDEHIEHIDSTDNGTEAQ
jgi:hypothetical protein